jgi:hypothetical protein
MAGTDGQPQSRLLTVAFEAPFCFRDYLRNRTEPSSSGGVGLARQELEVGLHGGNPAALSGARNCPPSRVRNATQCAFLAALHESAPGTTLPDRRPGWRVGERCNIRRAQPLGASGK